MLTNPVRSFSFQSFTYARPFLTSNKFVLIENPMDKNPYLKLRPNGKHIPLDKEMSLTELEGSLKSSGEA